MSKGGDLEELEKIQQMRIQYTNYYDTGDLEGVVSLFADDASVDAGAAGGAKGIDEVPAYFASQIEATGRTMHFISNPQIDFTGDDTAKGTWYL